MWLPWVSGQETKLQSRPCGPKGSELPRFPLALAPSPAGLTPRALQTPVQQQNAAQPLAAPDGPKLGGRAQQTGV